MADVLAPVITPEMIAYSRTRYALYFLGYAWSAAALLLVLSSGLSARFAAFAESKSRHRLGQVAIFLVLFSATYVVLKLPLFFYGGYWLDHQYNLSNKSLSLWVVDLLKSFALGAAISIPAYAAILWIVRRFARTWWIWGWLVSVVVAAAAIFLHPLVVDPIYNKLTPMAPSALRTKIEGLAERAGIAGAPIFIVDASRRTTKTNAYVTGFGTSHRIVIWDTLLASMPEDQVLAVIAHEIGHYALRHIFWVFALSIPVGLIGWWVLYLVAEPIRRRLPRSWGVDRLSSTTVIPVLTLGTLLVSFFSSPVEAAISRFIEHQADEYGLSLTGNPEAMAHSFVSLSQNNLSEPNPPRFIVLWMFSHPPLQERIDFALGKR